MHTVENAREGVHSSSSDSTPLNGPQTTTHHARSSTFHPRDPTRRPPRTQRTRPGKSLIGCRSLKALCSLQSEAVTGSSPLTRAESPLAARAFLNIIFRIMPRKKQKTSREPLFLIGESRLLLLPMEVLLPVAEAMPNPDLHAFIRTCQFAATFGHEVLYRRDNNASFPQALCSAAVLSGSAIQYRRQRSIKILAKIEKWWPEGDNSPKISSSVEAQMMHWGQSTTLPDAQASLVLLTAALGSIEFMRQPLRLGASTKTAGYGVTKFIPRRAAATVEPNVLHALTDFDD